MAGFTKLQKNTRLISKSSLLKKKKKRKHVNKRPYFVFIRYTTRTLCYIAPSFCDKTAVSFLSRLCIITFYEYSSHAPILESRRIRSRCPVCFHVNREKTPYFSFNSIISNSNTPKFWKQSESEDNSKEEKKLTPHARILSTIFLILRFHSV